MKHLFKNDEPIVLGYEKVVSNVEKVKCRK